MFLVSFHYLCDTFFRPGFFPAEPQVFVYYYYVQVSSRRFTFNYGEDVAGSVSCPAFIIIAFASGDTGGFSSSPTKLHRSYSYVVGSDDVPNAMKCFVKIPDHFVNANYDN